MITVSAQKQLLIKSFGFGIVIAEFVPSPSSDENVKEELFKHIRSSGLDVLEIIQDVQNQNRVFVLLYSGQPPCILEKNQIEPNDIELLENSAKIAMSNEFIKRIDMLKEALK
jgi:hypothetical protein